MFCTKLSVPVCLCHLTDEVETNDLPFSVNMSADDLSKWLQLKGVVEEDCVAFQGKLEFILQCSASTACKINYSFGRSSG